MRRVDVAVVGIGAMGSAALWRLAARGVAAIGFEQYTPGHDQGSSHGESRIIRTAYFESPHYVPLVQHAFTLWRQLERESGAALLTMTGALMIGPPACELVTGTVASTREHGLAHDLLDAAAMGRRYPQHHLDAGEVAVYEANAGVLRPEAAVVAMAGQAERRGATIARQSPVEAIEARAEGVWIRTGGEDYAARHAIVALGPWLPRFLPALALPVTLRVQRQVQMWFPVEHPARFSPARFPVFMHETAAGRWRYGFPTLDDRTVKLAVHYEGMAAAADSIDRAVHPADVAPMVDFIRHYLPEVEPVMARGQVCMYTTTPDQHFLVGPAPGLPAVTVLGGFSGHGFKFAPVIGEIAADLALAGRTRYPIGLFAPDRFAR